jgi:SAM-dependent methyltransferase
VTDDPKQVVAEAFGAAAATYGVTGPDFFWPLGRELVTAAGVGPGELVLDVACGTGALSSAAADAGARAVAVDLAPGMVEVARANGVDARVMDAETLDFPDGSFDHVVCGFAIFFLPDPERALSEWRRVLRPGGGLAFSTFVRRDPRWAWVAELLPERVRPRPAPDRFDSEPELAGLVESAGFADVRFERASYELRFADADEWWAWSWSHGHRRVLGRLTPDELDAFRAATGERIAAMPSITQAISARFTLARRA